jgi:hypothetical protein
MKIDYIMTIYAILIMTITLIIPRLPKNIIHALNNIFIRGLLIFIILYTSLYNDTKIISLLTMILFISTIYHYNKYKMLYTNI